MKLALAAVLGGLQSLGHDEAREKPVDRLGAMAASQIARAKDAERTAALCSLGVDLIRFKFANIEAARLDAEDRLALALTWRHKADDLSDRERGRVARWAVREWGIDLCPRCKGAGKTPDFVVPIEGKQPMSECVDCWGSGKRRYTDAERTEAMGQLFAKALDEAHSLIAWAESLAVQRARDQCERA